MSNTLLEKLASAVNQNRLGHGVMINLPFNMIGDCGLKNISPLLKSILCINGNACGNCESCWTFNQPNVTSRHPDLISLSPAEGSMNFAVDEVRDTIRRFGLHKNLSPRRVLLIRQGHLLSRAGGSAGNSLLKLIEEPHPDSFIILMTHLPNQVLATIKSRMMSFNLPAKELIDADQGENSFDHASWQEMENWLHAGASTKEMIAIPADSDGFWKVREKAFFELENAYAYLWASVRQSWAGYTQEESKRVLRVFTLWEHLLVRMSSYVNQPLQWDAFRQAISY